MTSIDKQSKLIEVNQQIENDEVLKTYDVQLNELDYKDCSIVNSAIDEKPIYNQKINNSANDDSNIIQTINDPELINKLSVKLDISEPPKLISSNQLPKLISNGQIPKLILTTSQAPPKLISSSSSELISEFKNGTLNDLGFKSINEQNMVQNIGQNLNQNSVLPDAPSLVYDSIVVSFNEEIVTDDNLIDYNLDQIEINSKDTFLLDENNLTAISKDKLEEDTKTVNLNEMINLNNLDNLADPPNDQIISTNGCLINIDEKANNQWSNSSRDLTNPDSLFFFDKYFLRSDEHSESIIQDCVQSFDQQSESNLINSQAESLFKFENDDQKPSTIELNYLSTQYQNNPNYFQHHHITQTNPIHSHLFPHSSVNPYDYHVHHHAMLNNLNTSRSNLNATSSASNNYGDSTTVTYSNGTNNLLPTTHHHLTTFNSNEQHANQSQYYTSQQTSLYSNFSTGAFNDFTSDNSFGYSTSASTQQVANNSQLRTTNHIMPHPIFDTDNAFIEHNQDKQENRFQDDRNLSKGKTIKEERLDEFCIRNSLDLVNSADLMEMNGAANEQTINNIATNDQLMNNQIVNQNLNNNTNINNQSLIPQTSKIVSRASKLNKEEYYYSSDCKPVLLKNAITSMKMNSGNVVKMNAGNIVNCSKKLITLKEAASVKLEKVKIERANGMKIYYFKCSLCTYQTNTSQSMKDHLYCIHCKAKNNYKCNICHQTFGWKNNAQRHMRRKHKIEDQTTKREAIITLI